MKNLLSLFTALGLLVFVVTPIYAQEVDVVLDDEQEIVADVEDITVEDVNVEDDFNYWIDEDGVVLETAENTSLEQVFAENPEMVNDLNVGLDEFLGVLEDENEGITDEFNAQFTTDEERAAAAVGFFAVFAGLLLIIGVVYFVWWIIKTIALWKAFEKAWEPGWKAIVPVYNLYIQFKLANFKNWFWCVFVLSIIISCLNLIKNPDYSSYIVLIAGVLGVVVSVISIIAAFKFARKYGWWVFASILFVVFYPLCILILGFGKSKYEWDKSEETVVEA